MSDDCITRERAAVVGVRRFLFHLREGKGIGRCKGIPSSVRREADRLLADYPFTHRIEEMYEADRLATLLIESGEAGREIYLLLRRKGLLKWRDGWTFTDTEDGRPKKGQE